MADQKSSGRWVSILLLVIGLVIGILIGRQLAPYPELPSQVVIQANVDRAASPSTVPDKPYLSLKKNEKAEWFFTQDNWKIAFTDTNLPLPDCSQPRHCTWPRNGVATDHIKPGTYEYSYVPPREAQSSGGPAKVDPQLIVGD